MGSVLIVDSDRVFSEMLKDVATGMDHDASHASTIADGLEALRFGHFDVVFLAAQMPDGSGLDALPRILDASNDPEVIVVSEYGNPDEAELAIKKGAWDYIDRPSSKKQFVLPLVRALQYRAKKVPRRPSAVLKKETFRGIVGSSPQIRACLGLLAQAANSDANVLITGETGTGKELFAWAIHDNSRRSKRNFVVVDCASLPDTLVESTLFGHKKGAYTGAEQDQEGLIRQANGGTLFLDEVGELPFPIQKAFLRVIQEHRFRPVGGKKEIESDFRLISASNRDLDNMVRQGRFRKDLLFRLRALSIDLPPMRKRAEDVKALALYHMDNLCEAYGTKPKDCSPEFFKVLLEYHWPGNIRELINALERAIVAAGDEPTLFPKHLPIHLRIHAARASVANGEKEAGVARGNRGTQASLPILRDIREAAVADAEEGYLRELMFVTGGNIKEACRISGLSRSRLYHLLRTHRVPRPR